MTEMMIRPSTALDIPISAPPAGDHYGRLMQWAEAAGAVHRMAQMICRTAFVPEAFKNKPDETAAAILSGLEVGLEPMAALRSFDIIQGTAAPRALTQRAVVQSHGHRMWETETTATRAIVKGQRRGEADIHVSTWTIDRAKQLGLLGKKNWREQPQAMLLARATAECARMTAADALLGIPYASEELDDGDTVTPTVAEEVKPARRTAQRRQVEAQPAPEPDLPEPVADAEVVEPAEPMISDEQQRKMRAILGDLGLGGKDRRDDVLAKVSLIIGRDIDTSKDLTIGEAGRVIDVLGAELLAQRAGEPDYGDDWPPAADIPGGES